MGATPERRLRYNANEMFRGRVGREYWRNAGEGRTSTSANRYERRFHQILDEEYQKVARSGSDTLRTLESGSVGEQGRHDSLAMVRNFLLVIAGAGIAVLGRKLIRASGYGRRGARAERR